MEHHGNLPVDMTKRNVAKRFVGDKAMDNDKKWLESNVPAGIVNELVNMRDERELSYAFFRKIKKIMVLEQLNGSKSMADAHSRILEDDSNIRWVAYYGLLLEAEKKARV